MGIDADIGPVVLVAEVVCNLERQVVKMRRMRRVSRGAVGFEEELQSRGMGHDAFGWELLLLQALAARLGEVIADGGERTAVRLADALEGFRASWSSATRAL